MLEGTMMQMEARFGKQMAHVKKNIRDKSLQALQKWLTAREAHMRQDELLKVWKGLFYCMWMSDKTAVQQELAKSLAELVHIFQTEEVALLFHQCFWITISREWLGIDKFRLDKFYSLIRASVFQMFIWLQGREWNDVTIETYSHILAKNALLEAPNGIRFHVADIYLEELHRATRKAIPDKVVLRLLSPFVDVMIQCQDRTEAERLGVRVIESLIQEGTGPVEVHSKTVVGELAESLLRKASLGETAQKHRSMLFQLHSKLSKFAGTKSTIVNEPIPQAHRLTEMLQPRLVEKSSDNTHDNRGLKNKSRKRKLKSGSTSDLTGESAGPEAAARHRVSGRDEDKRMKIISISEANADKRGFRLASKDYRRAHSAAYITDLADSQQSIDKQPKISDACIKCGGRGKGVVGKNGFCEHCNRTQRRVSVKHPASKGKGNSKEEVGNTNKECSKKITFSAHVEKREYKESRKGLQMQVGEDQSHTKQPIRGALKKRPLAADFF